MGKVKKAKQPSNIKSDKNVNSVTKKTLLKGKGKILFEKNITPLKHKSKKDKLKMKKKNLRTKIDLVKQQQKEEIAKKKREKTVITGDLKPLKDALPSLDELFKLKPTEIKTGLVIDQDSGNVKKLSKTKKIKKRKKEFMDRYNSFQSLLNDPEYKKNPREAIAFHIRYINNLEN